MNKTKKDEIKERQLNILEKGFKMGKYKFNRNALHEERLNKILKYYKKSSKP